MNATRNQPADPPQGGRAGPRRVRQEQRRLRDLDAEGDRCRCRRRRGGGDRLPQHRPDAPPRRHRGRRPGR
ncbi:hypothetical protein G5V59_05550 [Nocardioides sp. W3-2-3]|nr:hypothetical protein [Nocardioides convexus]